MKLLYLILASAVVCNVLIGVYIYCHPGPRTSLSNGHHLLSPLAFLEQPRSHRTCSVPKEPVDVCSATVPFRGTMKSRNKALAVLSLAASVQGLPGDVVEAGVAEGGGSLPLLFYLACTGDLRDRKIHLFDSWEGLPLSQAWQDNGFKPKMFNKSYDSFLDNVKFFQERYEEIWLQRKELGLPHGAISWKDAWNRVRIYKGFFADTMPQTLMLTRLSLLMCDGDMYQSSMDCLESAGRRVVHGGWIYNDDYYEFLGNYKAVVGFRQLLDSSAFEQRFEESSMLLVPSRGSFSFIEESREECQPPADNEFMRGIVKDAPALPHATPEPSSGGKCSGRPCEAGVWQRLQSSYI